MDCKHDFIGGASGVKCTKCGLTMTHEEYNKYLKPAPKKTTKKKDDKAAE